MPRFFTTNMTIHLIQVLNLLFVVIVFWGASTVCSCLYGGNAIKLIFKTKIQVEYLNIFTPEMLNITQDKIKYRIMELNNNESTDIFRRW